MADEAFAVSHMLCSFTGGKIDLVNVHGIRISGGSGGSGVLSWGNVAVPSSSEFSESHHILVELSCLFKLLFTFPACFLLPFQECGGVHHDGKLLCGLHSQILPSSAHSSVAQGHVELLSVLMTMM